MNHPPPQVVIVQNQPAPGCLHGGCANVFWFVVVLVAVLVVGAVVIGVVAAH